MKITNIIESKRWKHKITENTASIYGAVPWTNEIDKTNWNVEVVGYTWVTDKGTVGLGRAPVKTMREAVLIMERINSL